MVRSEHYGATPSVIVCGVQIKEAPVSHLKSFSIHKTSVAVFVNSPSFQIPNTGSGTNLINTKIGQRLALSKILFIAIKNHDSLAPLPNRKAVVLNTHQRLHTGSVPIHALTLY